MNSNYKHLLIEVFIDICLVLGLLLLFSPMLKNSYIAYGIAEQQLKKVEVLPDKIAQEEKIYLPKISSIVDNVCSNRTSYYGTVVIDRLAWAQPLFVGMTNENLLGGGVVVYPQRNLTADNFVVVGHHLGMSQLLFGKLLDVRQDDYIVIDYLDEQQTYQVSQISIVDESEISILDNSKTSKLTLITCPVAAPTSERLVIIATKVERTNEETVSKKNNGSAENQATLLRYNSHSKQWSLALKGPFILLVCICCAIAIVRYTFWKESRK